MKRIKYISRFAEPWSRADIESLVEQAATNNAKLGVTGVLMTSGGLFFQVLEGPDDVVDALYARIAKDRRHSDLLLLKAETGVTRRIFPDWSMRAVVLEPEEESRLEPLRVILETVSELQDRLGVLSRTLERALWAELSSITPPES